MNPFDLTVVIILFWAAIAGYRDGLLKQFVSWIGFAAGLYVAYHYGTQVSEQTGMSTIVTFAVLCIGVPLTGSLLASLITKFFDATIILGFANRVGGLVLSIFKYALLLSFVTYFGSMIIDVPESTQAESHFYAFFHDFGIDLWNKL